MEPTPPGADRGRTTRLVHGDVDLRPGGAVVPPIEQASTFAAADSDDFARAASTARGSDFYTRYGNPNHDQVAALIADLEGAETALVTASGMAAISTVVLALAQAGDHVVVQRSTYGGVISLTAKLLPRFGINATVVDQTDLVAWERAITPGTRLVLVETPSNPLLQVTDLAAVSALAHAQGALVLADNTFATPINQRPLEFGVDLVWHSATKYLGGHSDLLAGCVAGSTALIEQVWETALVTGAVLGPFDAWLLLRGLRTLDLRVARHNANGLAIAEALSTHPAIAAVHYPGLPGDRGHELAVRQMSGFGGVLSFELRDGADAARTFVADLRLARHAVSLGSVESLVVHAASMWSGAMAAADLAAAGIAPGLVRFAAGIEDAGDLIADILRALDTVSD